MNEVVYGESLIQGCKQYFLKGKFAEAINLGNKAREWFDAQGDLVKVCEVYRILGSLYATSNDEIKAANSFYSAIRLAGKIGDMRQMWMAYNNVAVLYYFLGEKETALEYILHCKTVYEKYSDPSDQEYYEEGTGLYCNCADMVLDMDDYVNGWKLLEKAEEFLTHIDCDGENDRNRELARSIHVLRCFNTYKQEPTEENLKPIEGLIDSVKDITVYSPNYWNFIYTLYQNLERIGADDLMLKVINSTDEQLKKGGEAYWLKQLEVKMDFYARIGDRDKYAYVCAEYMDMMKKDKKARLKEKAEVIDMNFRIMDREMDLDNDLNNSMIDGLTGLGNRRKLEVDSKNILGSSEGSTIVVGMIDMDFFKSINDSYGHIKGDDYLISVSRAMIKVFSGKAYGYRFGGDEFVILGQDISPQEMEMLADKLAIEVAELNLDNPHSEVSDKLTLSQGYYVTDKRAGLSFKELVERADKQLYRIKKNGRNGWAVEDDTSREGQ